MEYTAGAQRRTAGLRETALETAFLADALGFLYTARMGAGTKGLFAAMAAIALAGCAPAPTRSSAPTPSVRLPTPSPQSGCRTDSGVALPSLSGESTPADAVSAYLAAGGDPAAVAAELFDRGWVSPRSTVVWTDLNGDGTLDLAAGLTGAPDPQGIAASGSVVVWLCEGGAYRRAEAAVARSGFELPALLEVRDLTADGIPEMIVSFPLCGAHTCFAQYAVYQWDGNEMIDRFRGASDDLPYPVLAYKSEAPGAPLSIEITATAIGSVGAGPFRVRARTWTWDAAAPAFIPGALIFQAPRYRIHLIYDADDAYRRGDLPDALGLYQRAMEDETLLDWPSPGDRREELSSYAAFRRILVYLAADDRAEAQAELDSRFSGASPTTAAYAELSRRLMSGAESGSLEQACDEVASFAREQAQAVLAPLDFGYDNRAYAAEDLCQLPGTEEDAR